MLSKIEMELCERQEEAHPEEVRELKEAARVHGLLDGDAASMFAQYEVVAGRRNAARERHQRAAIALLDAMGAES